MEKFYFSITKDFDINLRSSLKTKNINKITKGVYELGSIFKTFTVAIALENDLVKPKTIIQNILSLLNVQNIIFPILKNFQKLSVEDILIRSSNVGILLARKIGEENMKF